MGEVNPDKVSFTGVFLGFIIDTFEQITEATSQKIYSPKPLHTCIMLLYGNSAGWEKLILIR